MLLPGQMNKLRVCAHRDEFRIEFDKRVVLLCQSGELRCSDKCKIRGIKEENGPLPFFLELFHRDRPKQTGTRIKSFHFEIGNGLTDFQPATNVFGYHGITSMDFAVE